MKCMVPGQNMKILARALHSLARVGDDLFVDPLIDGLTLRTVNSSQSAFAEFMFFPSFFSSYSIDGASPDALPKCKVSMRSCLSVFKSPNSMDKLVDWCQLRLEYEGVNLIFKVKFTGGSTKTYFLPIIESETIQVKYKKSNSVKLIASPKLLSGVVKNFRLNEDEITLAVTKHKATFRNHVDTCSERNKTVRTELGLLAGEFETYSVNEPVSLTFCLKQLRAVVALAEPLGLPINLYFEVPGRPVILTVFHESVYEANFIVSTLVTVGESQSQGSQKSDISLGRDVQNRSKHEKKVGKQCNIIQPQPVASSSNNNNTNKNDHEMIHNGTISDNNTSRKRNRDSDEMISNFEKSNKIANCNSDNSVYQSVLSNNSMADTVLIPNDNMEVEESIQNSPQSFKNTANSIFVRCFNSTFQRGLLPGFNNVIAYDSDGLEDSD